MKALVLVLSAALLLAGCSSANAADLTPKIVTDAASITDTWITSTGIIDNAFPGCNVISSGMKLHNGDGDHETTQKTAIGTDPGETVVDVPLRAPLANNAIESVTLLQSDNPSDVLTVTGYDKDNQTARIEGFAPASKRTVTLTYSAWNRYVLEYYVVTDVMKGYKLPPEAAKDWVSFSNSVVLGPQGTVEIPLRFAIPKDVKAKSLPSKWEFGIRASDTNQGMINKGVLCTFLVTMR
jgi:hypothetical protein